MTLKYYSLELQSRMQGKTLDVCPSFVEHCIIASRFGRLKWFSPLYSWSSYIIDLSQTCLFTTIVGCTCLHLLSKLHLCSHNFNTFYIQELYSQSYTRVGVIFASITNFHEFYTELDGNNQGVKYF